MPYDYFHSKAADFLARAGAPDADPTQLATWAQQVKDSGDTTNPRAIVAEDGTVACVARRHGTPNGPRAYYIESTPQTEEWGVAGRVSDMSLGRIRRAIGQRVIEVALSAVASGPAVRKPLHPEVEGELARLVADYQQQREAFEEAERAYQGEIGRIAAEPGANIRQIAQRAGVTRQTIYSWRDTYHGK